MRLMFSEKTILKMPSLREKFWKNVFLREQFWKCLFWGSSFKDVFLDRAILNNYFLGEQFWKGNVLFEGVILINRFWKLMFYYLREQFWKCIFWRNNFEKMYFLREQFWEKCIFLREPFQKSIFENVIFEQTVLKVYFLMINFENALWR